VLAVRRFHEQAARGRTSRVKHARATVGAHFFIASVLPDGGGTVAVIAGILQGLCEMFRLMTFIHHNAMPFMLYGTF
jgi:hypothetical protein